MHVLNSSGQGAGLRTLFLSVLLIGDSLHVTVSAESIEAVATRGSVPAVRNPKLMSGILAETTKVILVFRLHDILVAIEERVQVRRSSK